MSNINNEEQQKFIEQSKQDLETALKANCILGMQVILRKYGGSIAAAIEGFPACAMLLSDALLQESSTIVLDRRLR